MSMWIPEHNPIRFFLAPHGSHACPDRHSRLRRWHAVDHLILRLVHQWRGWRQHSPWKIIYQLSHLNVRRIKALWWNSHSHLDLITWSEHCISMNKYMKWEHLNENLVFGIIFNALKKSSYHNVFGAPMNRMMTTIFPTKNNGQASKE